MNEEYEEYACQYDFDGKNWCIEIHARSRAEAERKLRAVGSGKVLGPIGAEIHVPDNEAAIAPMKWMMNRAIALMNFSNNHKE